MDEAPGSIQPGRPCWYWPTFATVTPRPGWPAVSRSASRPPGDTFVKAWTARRHRTHPFSRRWAGITRLAYAILDGTLIPIDRIANQQQALGPLDVGSTSAAQEGVCHGQYRRSSGVCCAEAAIHNPGWVRWPAADQAADRQPRLHRDGGHGHAAGSLGWATHLRRRFPAGTNDSCRRVSWPGERQVDTPTMTL